MRRASVNFKLLDHLATKAVTGKHAFDCVLDNEFVLLFTHFFHRNVAFAAHPARIKHVVFIGVLLARNTDLLSIDNYDEVAGVSMRSIDSLVAAAQYIGDFYGDTAECFVGSVYHEPVFGVV